MSTVKITQVRSSIRTMPKQRKTLEALGLKKIGQTVEQEMSASLTGMLRVVSHLVDVQEK